MNYLFKIIIVIALAGCSSLPEKVEVKNEVIIPKILLPNAPEVISLENYDIMTVKMDNIGLMCLDSKNFKIVGNNDAKMEAYIKELEDQLNYLRDVIRKQNQSSKASDSY